MNDTLKMFSAFEKDKNLFSRTYLGIPYWQSIRVIFSRSTIYGTKLSSGTQNFSNKLLLGLKLSKNVIIDILKYVRLSKCDILYFDECIYRVVGGVTVDAYFDYFDFGKEYKVERCFHIYDRRDKTTLNGIGTTLPEMRKLLLTLCSKIGVGNHRDKKEDLFLKQLAIDLEKEFHMGFSYEELLKMVRRIVIIHKAYGKFYERLLKKCSPKSIILVCHYSNYLFPLCAVAHKYSIPVIELQHGLIVNHDAYWYGDTTNIGKELPDYLFSYGEFWNTQIQLPDNVKVVPIGNPFLEERKEKYKNCISDEKAIVLYSSAPFEKEMELLAINIWNHFGKKGYKIFFKIHPLDYDTWQEHYRLLLEYPQIQMVPPDKDLYELLSGAKHHITFASTVLYEAVIFNNNRYIYDLGILSENMEPLAQLKLAYKFKTIEELEELLNISMGTVSDDKLEVWKGDAKGNGLKKLREIINE